MLVNFGLVLVILAWVYQLFKVMSGSRQIDPVFVGIYVLGVVILTYDGIVGQLTTMAALNLLSAVAAGGVLVFLLSKKQQ